MSNKLVITYVLLVAILSSTIGMAYGYSLKHPPVYVRIKYEDTQKSLRKAMDDAKITYSDEQYEILTRGLKK